MFKLREELEENVLDLGPHLVGFGVCLPDVVFDRRSVEWTPKILFDASDGDTSECFARYLRRMTEHWKSMKPDTRPLSTPNIQEVVAFLRPSFEVVPSVSSVLSRLTQQMNRLTDEQYRIIDAAHNFPRLLCEGGAGTGKTFVAREVALRFGFDHARVGFVVLNPFLAAFLRSRTNVPNVQVLDFNTLAALPDDALDALVVDEGQDLMTDTHLDVLERVLVDGLSRGHWRIFLDPNAQSGLEGNFDPAAYKRLKSIQPPMDLKVNCRNTRDIVLQTRLMSGADLGTAFAGDGPPVEIVYVRNREEATQRLERTLTDLAKDGIPAGEITILSPRPLGASCVADLPAAIRDRIVAITPENAGHLPLPQTTFARIRDFKGLENQAVVVVDLDEVGSAATDVALIYVAMSRARARLVLSIDARLADRVNEIQSQHLPLVLASTPHD
jgi:hypothetical protein